MVNLEWYRTFKAVYQNGNLTRAAEELLISQPNVSIQLAALESYIGHKLFDRTSRRLSPTEYGKLLYSQIVGSIENLEKTEVTFRKAVLKRLENLRIGSPIEYAHNILLDKLKDCTVEVSLQFGLPDQLTDLIAKGELDFAILTQKSDKENISHEALIEENFMIIGHASYDTRELDKYISDNNIKMVEKWLLDQKWIAYDAKLSMIRRFWLENFKNRPLIKPHYIIPNIDMILKATHLNYGITIASDLFVGDSLTHQRLKIIWKGNDITRNQLWLAYDPSKVEEKQIETMRSILGINTSGK